MSDSLKELEEKIGHVFARPELLARAVTTPSVRMTRPDAKDNQRLEFLGDAVFGLLTADALFRAHAEDQEGALTVRRTHLVSTDAMTAAAARLGLAAYLRRNAGAAELPPHAKALADALEAVMGAVWLDGGLAAAQAFFARLELPLGDELREWELNPKGALQVRAQAQRPPVKPVYRIDSVKGPGHAPVVTVTVSVAGLGEATATAVSKSAAEVAAAAKLMEELA